MTHQTDGGAAAPPATPHAQPVAAGGEMAAESATTTAAPPSPHSEPKVLPNEYCWCGGEVGPRSPGDHLGLGCLANIVHNWNAASQESQDLIEAEQAFQSPYDCRNCEDSDPGASHVFDEHCGADKCEPGCFFFAPHPTHPCRRAS